MSTFDIIRAKVVGSTQRKAAVARRRYQDGGLVKRGGMWYAKYRETTVDENKVEIRIQKLVPLCSVQDYPTKKAALPLLRKFMEPINAMSTRPGRSATIEQFSIQWDRQIVSHWKESSADAAHSHLNKYIKPILGSIPLTDFDVQAQQEFVGCLAEDVSAKTLRNVLGTLSSMLQTAKKWGYITQELSLKNLTLPEWRKGKGRTFTPEQAQAILDAAAQPWKLMFSISAYLGLRAGEVLGLRGEDIDWERRILCINQTAWYGNIQTSKSEGSDDTLPIPDALFDMLVAHGVRNGLLFINRRKRPYTSEKVVQRRLWPLCDRFGIPRAGFHAFRHLHTSLLLATGASPKVAQRQLRHSDPRITLDLYAHIIGDEQRRAVENAAKMLDEKPVSVVSNPVSTPPQPTDQQYLN